MRVLRILKWTLLSILAMLLAYATVVVVGTLVPVNSDYEPVEDGVEIFVTSNGTHTSLVVPVATAGRDWASFLDLELFEQAPQDIRFLSFGWGDKQFYLHTPTWEDLTFATACKSVLWPTESAMHVIAKANAPVPGDRVIPKRISSDNYLALCDYLSQSFALSEQGKPQPILCCDYSGIDDYFFEGTGSYHGLKTCNNWTNQGLQIAGVKTAWWAPLEMGVMYHLN